MYNGLWLWCHQLSSIYIIVFDSREIEQENNTVYRIRCGCIRFLISGTDHVSECQLAATIAILQCHLCSCSSVSYGNFMAD